MNARMSTTRTFFRSCVLRPGLTLSALAAMAAMACATGTAAQSAPAPDEERLLTLIGGLPLGQNIQVSTPQILVEEALLVSVQGGTVELEQIGTGVPIVVDLEAIRGVSVQRRHWLQGTVWGVSGGLLAGSMFGLIIGSFYCNSIDQCGNEERAGALRWGTTLALVGGGIGFTLGRRDVYWHPIFP